MIYALALITTLATIFIFFYVQRVSGIRKVVAKILVNTALIVGLISLYLFWLFIFKQIV
jgi:hypothetical protein